MVEQQLRTRDVEDERVLEAMERVPRHLFVPEELRARAYADAALPIGSGQTISQPYMVARICEALSLQGNERVLDVGTGSGYQAAVLAELAGEVHTIERLPELADAARARLEEAGYGGRVHVHVGDGTLGLPEQAPFGAIAVAAAAPRASAEPLRPARASRTTRRAGRQAARPAAPARRAEPGGARRGAVGVLPFRAPARRGGLRGLTRGHERPRGFVSG